MSPTRVTTRIINMVSRFLAGWGFPAFFLFTLAFGTVLLAVMLVLPTEGTALEQFAQDFRVWCFGYDPETGQTEWAYAATMLSAPFMLGGFALLFWWAPLREALRRPAVLWRAALPAAAVILALALGMGALGGLFGGAEDEPLAFPADSLRLDRDPPAFELVDQQGETVSLAELEGRVVVVTGIYASCAIACPLILGQAKRVLQSLSPRLREEVVVVGITFDPGHDSPEVLARMARSHGVGAPQFRLVTGKPEQVNAVLDRFGFARKRDPETGVIDHANLFYVIDRNGKLAYRFSLGEQQEAWLGEALRILLREPVPSA